MTADGSLDDVTRSSPGETTSDGSLPEFLAVRARRASDGRLVLDVAVGLIAGAGALVFRPVAWLLMICAATCLATFGVWGIADRELGERAQTAGHALSFSLRTVRVIAAVVGGVAAILILFVALGIALGRIIS